MKHLINSLIKQGYLKTPLIIEAFQKIKREDFIPEDLQDEADGNFPLPIGHGQTISQPLTVAFMLELLEPKPGEKILDVGSGSGWQTAMLCHIVGKSGKVFAMERVPELVEFGKNNVSKYNFVASGRAVFLHSDGTKGYEKEAPYDKIIVAAAARGIPEALKEQLKIGGRLVIPTKSQDIRLFEKIGKDEFKEKIIPGFVFVPLISD